MKLGWYEFDFVRTEEFFFLGYTFGLDVVFNGILIAITALITLGHCERLNKIKIVLSQYRLHVYAPTKTENFSSLMWYYFKTK